MFQKFEKKAKQSCPPSLTINNEVLQYNRMMSWSEMLQFNKMPWIVPRRTQIIQTALHNILASENWNKRLCIVFSNNRENFYLPIPVLSSWPDESENLNLQVCFRAKPSYFPEGSNCKQEIPVLITMLPYPPYLIPLELTVFLLPIVTPQCGSLSCIHYMINTVSD